MIAGIAGPTILIGKANVIVGGSFRTIFPNAAQSTALATAAIATTCHPMDFQ
jgi:hypothetical protein